MSLKLGILFGNAIIEKKSTLLRKLWGGAVNFYYNIEKIKTNETTKDNHLFLIPKCMYYIS